MPAKNPTKLKVAIAQIDTIAGDIDAALHKHLDMIGAARSIGAEVLLFPELSLTGHNGGRQTLELALRRDDPRLRKLAAAAGDMATIFGFIEEAPGGLFYNAAALVREGRVDLVHRKVNLATYGALEDGKHFGAGEYIEIFALGALWRVAVLICADLWNPALVHLAALQGATLLLAPVSSAVEAVGAEFDNPGGWDLCLRFYGMMYGFPLVMANRVGQEGGLTFWGGSRVVDPFGRVVAMAERPSEQFVTTELDYEALRRARYLLPTVRDANPVLVLRETERLLRPKGGVEPDGVQ
ncbi:MAG TPA: nitrilase-related carbon-nitrogen hydrolase [Alphaproteobacteria bacterium]|nr:nitrilase-related carbon-nitrogen hydrolase [Alphaproteobacteria bacterium]